jgi:indolepyruvate ferredoxin oxidoreductase
MPDNSSQLTEAPLREVSLDDKFLAPGGMQYLSGTQLLVRALLNQAERDKQRGFRTGGFVTGYRGSPLGGLDKELWKTATALTACNIVFKPGVNEELAAGAVAGTQQLHMFPSPKVEGVFSLWYAKGPGVDRSGDVIRHANLAGSAPRGGVVLACGDDHAGVSTTTNHQSDLALRAWNVPMLVPAEPQDVLDLCMHAWEASRCTGLYVGLKALADTVESSAPVDVSPSRVQAVLPDGEPLGIRPSDDRWAQERRVLDQRLPRFVEYVHLNQLNRVTQRRQGDRLGIIAVGKAWLDTLQALQDLGITQDDFEPLRLRLMKVTAPWPLHAGDMREFCEGLDEVVVVEEKAPVVEEQLRSLLFGLTKAPLVLGKLHAEGPPAPLHASGDLSSSEVARCLGQWLARWVDVPGHSTHLAFLSDKLAQAASLHGGASRQAYFCSGCPHSTSTRVPEGSLALAGVGCHYMALSAYPEHTRTFSVMGVEGANWTGVSSFTDLQHTFVNVGEGTYFHSALLSVRASVSAGVNITYKILFNDAVAMTGGQPVDGPLTVGALVAQLEAEGVRRVAVVAQELDAARDDLGLPRHVKVVDRDRLDAVQRELRETTGCTALVYVQTCAAEKRRRRKRGKYPDPERRLVIHEEVCEGCGDCGQASNCVSLLPLDTELGRKRAIDQSSCNKDYTCATGFCPSFVSVRGSSLRKSPRSSSWESEAARLPEPPRAAIEQSYNVLVTGIGGTGVLTVGALLGMAAHLQGMRVNVLDMTGMAQKNGGVQSHIRIAHGHGAFNARIPVGSADLLLACDVVEATTPSVLAATRAGRTRLGANTHRVMPAGFTRDPDFRLDTSRMDEALLAHLGSSDSRFIDATGEATAQLGDAMLANVVMLGFALQSGWLPLTLPALERAIELNGVAVAANKRALALGRVLATRKDSPGVREAFVAVDSIRRSGTAQHVDQVIQDRVARLRTYGRGLDARYEALVRSVRAAESVLPGAALPLTLAVARNFYKLLAIKDEYEVARLLSSAKFREDLERRFEPGLRVSYHLAPPLFARRGADGRPVKTEYGPWLRPFLRGLAAMRFLRNTPFDPFAWTHERRMERALVEDYEDTVSNLLKRLTKQNRSTLVAIAALPDAIRGYGHVKAASVAKAAVERERLLASLNAPVLDVPAAPAVPV